MLPTVACNKQTPQRLSGCRPPRRGALVGLSGRPRGVPGTVRQGRGRKEGVEGARSFELRRGKAALSCRSHITLSVKTKTRRPKPCFLRGLCIIYSLLRWVALNRPTLSVLDKYIFKISPIIIAALRKLKACFFQAVDGRLPIGRAPCRGRGAVCTRCGLVIDDVVDVGSEWRAYNAFQLVCIRAAP
jgi:hypothetical protein